MEANNRGRPSLEARLDELDRHMDRLEERAAQTRADAQARLRPRLDALRARSAGVRTQLHDKVGRDDAASDEALRELGHALNDMYAELGDRPGHV
ncbi:MAG TPA: hypothetical protein VKX16_03730 [Chloroflexota bacterium]|nr:hypothetical protein [Chloroflexota bacterium]